MPPNDGSPSGFENAAAAEHIAVEMSRLARLATAHRFALLPYLIDMAVLEAWREANETGPGGADPAKLE